MPAGDYLVGLVCFVVMLAAVAGGAGLLLVKRFASLTGVARTVGFAILATSGLLAVHLVPGVFGILARGSVLACSAIWFVVSLLVPARASVGQPAPPAQSSERSSQALAAVAVAALVLFTLAFARNQLVLAPGSIDTLNFHLPGVVSWIQTGSMWGIHEFLPDAAPGRYPNNGDVVLLAAVLPWHSDFLSHLVPYLYFVLTGLGIYAAAAEIGAPRPAAAVAGCLFMAIPVASVPGLANSFPDVIMYSGFAAGILFLLRHRRTAATGDLVIAGLALGISFGTKWYAVSSVAILVAVWTAARLLERRGWRSVARQAGILVGLIALAGGFWLLRNLVQSGNPVFPVKVELLGLTIFDAPRDTFREAIGFTIIDYIDDPSVWDAYILPQYGKSLAAPGVLLIAGFVLTLVLALSSRVRQRLADRGLLSAGLACTALLIVAYTITPYTAGGAAGMPTLVGGDSRYLLPALVVIAVMLAWTTRLHRLAPAILAALSVVTIAGGLQIASNGSISAASLKALDWVQALVVVAVGVALWAANRLSGVRGRRWRLAPAAIAITLLVGLAGIAGWRMQDTFLDNRYRGLDATTDWIRENSPAGARIGLAGTWGITFAPTLSAFGPRFENEVEYVGPIVDEMPREHSSGAAFVEDLDQGEFDYLIVGRGAPGAPSVAEERWARLAGYRLVVGSPLLRLLRAPQARPSGR